MLDATTDYSATKHYLNIQAQNISGLSNSQVTSYNIVPANNTSLTPTETGIATYTYKLTTGSTYTAFAGVTDAGSYNIKAIIQNSNYNDYELNAILTINKLERAVNWTGLGSTYTYNGFSQSSSVTASFDALAADGGTTNLTISYTYSETLGGTYLSASEFKDAGYYNFNVATPNPNYTLTNDVKALRMLKANVSLLFGNRSVGYTNTTYYLSANTIADYSGAYISSTNTTEHTGLGSDTWTIQYYVLSATGSYIIGDTVEPYSSGLTGDRADQFMGNKNAGIYNIIAIREESKNYNLWKKQGILTISKADIANITFLNDTTPVYDKTIHSIEITNTNNPNETQYGESINVSYNMNPLDSALDYSALTKNRAMSAGSYTVTATITAGANYNNLVLDATLGIAKATMYNVNDDQSLGDYYLHSKNNTDAKTYDGYTYFLNVVTTSTASSLSTSQVTSINIHPSTNLLATADTATITYTVSNITFTGAKNAGTYSIKAVLGNSNYNDLELTAILEIKPFKTTVTWSGIVDGDLNDIVYTYNAYNQASQISATYLQAAGDGGANIQLSVTINYKVSPELEWSAATEFKNAGYYQFIIAPPNANYTFDAGDIQRTKTMAKASIDYTFINSSVTFDNTTHYISAGTSTTLPCTDPYTTRPMSIDLLGSDTGTIDYKYTVDEQGFSYGGSWLEFNGGKNAGIYYIKAEISLSVSLAINYIPWNKQATLTINKATITNIDLEDKTVTYNGNLHEIEITANQTQHGISVSVSYSINPTDSATTSDKGAISAGNYVVSATVNATGADAANYNTLSLTADLVINKATMYNVDGTSSTFYFGAVVTDYNSYLQYLNVVTSSSASSLGSSKVTSLNISPVGEVHTDIATVTYKYSTTDGLYNMDFNGVKNKGTYYIEATLTNSNYISQVYTSSLTINPEQVILVLSGYEVEPNVEASYTYNGGNQLSSLTSYYTPIGDDVLYEGYVVTVTPQISYSQNNDGTYVSVLIFKNAGRYRFAFNNDAASNYIFIATQKELTMSKADIALYMLNNSVTYDTETHYLSASTSSLVANSTNQTEYQLLGSDTATVTYTFTQDAAGFAYTGGWVTFTGGVAAGTYYIRAIIDSTDITDGYLNYNVTSGKTTWVGEAILTITVSSILGLSLDGQGTYTYDGLVKIVELVNAESAEPVNTTQHGVVVTLYYTISPQDLAITYTGDLDKNRAKSAGEYVITATLNDPDKTGYNPNYTKLTLQATLTINKATMYNNIDESTVFYLHSLTGNDSLTFDGATHFLNVVTTSTETSLGTSKVTSLDIRPYKNAATIDSAAITYMYSNTPDVYNVAFNGARNKGTYYIKATLENKNYITQEYTAILTIKAYTATIVWVGFDDVNGDPIDYTYNGASQKNQLNAYYEMAQYEQTVDQTTRNIDFDISRGSDPSQYILIGDFFSAGYYKFEARVNDAAHSNYDFTGSEQIQYLVMDKADINMYMVGRTHEYNGYTQYIGVSESSTVSNTNNATSINLLGTDTAKVTYTFITPENPTPSAFNGQKDAGTYTITASIAVDTNAHGSGDNYNAWPNTTSPNANKANLVITKKALTVTSTSSPSNWTKVYDSTTEYDAFTVSGFVTNESNVNESTLFDVIATYQNKNVGTNKTISFAVLDKVTSETSINYTVSQVTTGVITAHKLQPTLTTWTKVYNGNDFYDRITSFVTTPFAGIYTGDTLYVDAYFNSKNVNAANYITFTLSGDDAGNYAIDNVTTNVSITKRSASVTWGETQIVYSGTTNVTTAYFELVGDDRTDENEGKESLIVKYYEYGTSDELAFRNVGKYTGKATINSASTDAGGEPYVNNYNIILAESEKDLEIIAKSVNVEWANLPIPVEEVLKYVYIGAQQGANINAKIVVVGTDTAISGVVDNKMTLTITIRTGGEVVAQIKNAGTYTLTASITHVYGDGFEMRLNYSLNDAVKEIIVEKADINNIFFNGSDTFSYWEGEEHSYYVVATSADNAFSSTKTAIYYQYDTTIEIQVIYSGGDSQFAGGNTVKNVGEYTITATVLATDNYNGISGFITVTITKGDISDEFVYYDKTMDYKGEYVFLYLTQDEETPNDIFQNIYYPDSTTPSVVYEYLVPSTTGYWKVLTHTGEGGVITYEVVVYDSGVHENSDRYDYDTFTSTTARNAGFYFLRATIPATGNYTSFSDIAQLQIKKITRDVLWYITLPVQGKKALDQASIIFDGTNKYSALEAEINSVGTDGIFVEGVLVNKINLFIDPNKLIHEDTTKSSSEYTYSTTVNDYVFNGGVAGEFRMAGNYSISAEFDADEDNLYYYSTNYTLRLSPVQTRIEKLNLLVKWFRNGQTVEYIDTNPFVYDGNEHGVQPQGYGLLDVTVPIVLTANLEKNAGTYRSTITRIKGGDVEEDGILTDGNIWSSGTPQSGYLFDYNYKLPGDSSLDTSRFRDWEIIKRQLTIIQGTTQDLYKYYNGSTLFSLVSTSTTLTTTTAGSAEGMPISIAHVYRSTQIQGGSSYLWEIDNIIESDVENVTISIETINSYLRTGTDPDYVDTLKKNITANLSKIVFNAFTHQNYYLFDIDDESEVQNFEIYEPTSNQNNPLVVKPRPITLTKDNIVKGYDGEGFDLVLNSANHINTTEGLQVIASIKDGANDNAIINGIYEDDYFSGRIYIRGNDYQLNPVEGEYARDAGEYQIMVAAGLKTYDAENVTNYIVSVDTADATYTIHERWLSLEYNYALQDLYSIKNGNAKNVTINSIGMIADDEYPMTNAEFLALLAADSLSASSFEMKNAWLDDAMSSNVYTRFAGTKDYENNDSTKLGIRITNARNKHNYMYRAPVLQITGVRLQDVEDADKNYLFKLDSSEDLYHLSYDIENLKATLDNYQVGRHPSYYQLSDIIASYKGRPIVLRTISSFAGNCYGNGFNIIGLTIIASGTNQNTAMFNILTGKISGMNLRKTTVVANNSSYVAPIAVQVDGGIIENSSFEGVISAHAETKAVTVGGLVALLIRGDITNSYSVSKIFAKTEGNITVGALIGETIIENQAEQTITSVGSFIEAKLDNVPSGEVVNPIFNEVVGKGNTSITSNVIFKDGVVVNGARIEIDSAQTYDAIMNVDTVVSSIIYNWVLNRAYTGPSEGAGTRKGTLMEPFILSFYTQFSLIRAYPYASFKLARTFIIPHHIKASEVQLDLEFYGAGFDSNGKNIYSRTLSINTNLFKYIYPNTAYSKNPTVEPIGDEVPSI